MHDLPSAVRDSLTRLAKSSDRASPTVFAGREAEFALLNDAVQGAQRDESGHTVVIQGVPGAGKTALLNEYAARLLTADGDVARPVIPVPLQPGTLAAPPVAIVQEVDRRFREFEASNEWQRRVNRAVSGASLFGNALFAAFTRRDFNDFRPSARSPDSLPIALEDYVDARTATRTIKELCTHGYVETRQGACRPTLAYLSPHFDELRQVCVPENEVLQAIRAALPDRKPGASAR